MGELLIYPNLSLRDTDKVLEWTEEQNRAMLCLVHPFYNVLIDPYWAHEETGYKRFQKKFKACAFGPDNQKAKAMRRTRRLLIEAPNILIKDRINETHRNYYNRVSKFLSNSNTQVLGVMEETGSIDSTAHLFRTMGYENNLLFFPSKPSNPEPDGYSFDEMAEFFMNLGIQRLLVGGQNCWVDGDNSAFVNQEYPFVLPADSSPLYFGNLSGCVGYFVVYLARTFRALSKNYGSQIPNIQLSPFSWPQRRSSDPTNN